MQRPVSHIIFKFNPSEIKYVNSDFLLLSDPPTPSVNYIIPNQVHDAHSSLVFIQITRPYPIMTSSEDGERSAGQPTRSSGSSSRTLKINILSVCWQKACHAAAGHQHYFVFSRAAAEWNADGQGQRQATSPINLHPKAQGRPVH